MNNKKTTRRALTTSVLSLVVCMSMLIGTTFAWFTDSVTSRNNIIKSGNLDVELEYSLDGETWAPVENDTAIFAEDDLWEPGHTVAAALRVKNAGTLALKYELSTNLYREKEGTNVYGETFKLSDYLEVYYGEPQAVGMVGDIITSLVMGGRDSALGNGTYMTKSAFNGAICGSNELAPEASHVMFIAITMPTTVGNEANYMTGTEAPYISFAIDLLATQTPYESDSFGKDYDKDATYPVLDASDFADALSQSGQYGISNDIEVDNFNVADDTTVGLALNGNTISGATIVNNGELTVSDGTIEVPAAGVENSGKATFTNVDMKAGTPTDYSNINTAGAVTEYNNVNIDSAGGGVGARDGAEVVFNSGSVKVHSTGNGGRYNFYAVGNGTTITINDGTFSFNTTNNVKLAYIYAGEGATVIVNGGTFGKAATRSGYTEGILGAGTVIIKGGTFGFNPTKWVADGYQAVEADGVWTVSAK